MSTQQGKKKVSREKEDFEPKNTLLVVTHSEVKTHVCSSMLHWLSISMKPVRTEPS